MTAQPDAEPMGLARLPSLDTVRGVAVMGILLMNIVGFAMPNPAYFNPRAYGGGEGPDLWVYLFNYILFDGKMRGLFSFLFGASMLLVIERAEAKSESPARVHYARMFWLLLFGLAHLWLVWWGDILNHYALIGMVAFAFRKRETGTLLIWGAGLVLMQSVLLWTLWGTVYHAQLNLGSAAPKIAAEAAKALAEFSKGFGILPPDALAANLAEHRGSYATILAGRFKQEMTGPLVGVMIFGAETLAYMLFGMAALRSGLLTGAWPRSRYWKWMAIGFGVTLPAYAAFAAWTVHEQFSLLAVVSGAMAFPTPIRPLAILAWACLILLLARPGGALTERIAAAGRMAFTNYLATSLICTTFFYGYGFGWFGYLSRWQLYLGVAAIWGLMLLWSKPWLSHFRYGPFEWLWRSLARGRLQPLRGPARAEPKAEGE